VLTRFVPKNGRKDDSLSKHLERQVAAEIDGDENITNPQKFALKVKFGLEDPVLVAEELKAIRAEEGQLNG
jgi:hypothetical protein